MKTFKLLATCMTAVALSASAQETEKKGLSLGGYGEAVMTRNFYSDNVYRYKWPGEHRNDASHGRFDVPHMVINLGYNFGSGWSLGTEIEFEHGGTESAVEYEADESGEYEAEVERGGEVAIEQLWINKAWLGGKINLRGGEIIVPVGAINARHEPNQFFGVYRPEGEATILPCTWHQVGVELWGRAGDWRYQVQFLSGLDSERFGSLDFVHYGATSSYEFKIANRYAGAARIDNYSIQGLRLGVSGYYGHTFWNSLASPSQTKYDGVTGALSIISGDFTLKRWNWIVRGNATYAHLDDASTITAYNNTLPLHHGQDGSPSKHQVVGRNAYAVGLEAGYDVFSRIRPLRSKQNLYVFGRIEAYDAMASGTQQAAYKWCGRKTYSVGVNYCPMKPITIKAEYQWRHINPMSDEVANSLSTHSGHTTEPLGQYNDEPSLSVGITYTGWFL